MWGRDDGTSGGLSPAGQCYELSPHQHNYSKQGHPTVAISHSVKDAEILWQHQFKNPFHLLEHQTAPMLMNYEKQSTTFPRTFPQDRQYVQTVLPLDQLENVNRFRRSDVYQQPSQRIDTPRHSPCSNLHPLFTRTGNTQRILTNAILHHHQPIRNSEPEVPPLGTESLQTGRPERKEYTRKPPSVEILENSSETSLCHQYITRTSISDSTNDKLLQIDVLLKSVPKHSLEWTRLSQLKAMYMSTESTMPENQLKATHVKQQAGLRNYEEYHKFIENQFGQKAEKSLNTPQEGSSFETERPLSQSKTKGNYMKDLIEKCAKQGFVQVKSKNTELPEKAVEIMKTWFAYNSEYPYPSRKAYLSMSKEGAITVTQARKWFANKRIRSGFTKTLKSTKRSLEDNEVDQSAKRLKLEG